MPTRSMPLLLAAFLLLASAGLIPTTGEAWAQSPTGPPSLDETEPMSITLETLPYPHPVQFLELQVRGEDVRMAYMDVPPQGPANGQTVVLMHGYNFFGEYWEGTIAALTERGFRVVVPDQIGFGRSSKPIFDYSFHRMGAHTRELLDHLGVERAALVAHSMGGMAATRFALMYPERSTRLALVNIVGMEDMRLLRPWRSTEEAYEAILNQSEESIRGGQERYYVEWRPEFEKYVQVHFGWRHSADWPRYAMVRAITSQMMYEQPVVYEFPEVTVPTLVIGGAEDGPRFREIAARTAEAVPDGELVLFDDVGHNPHLEAPELFHPALVDFLER